MRKLMMTLLPLLVVGLAACGQNHQATLPDEQGLAQGSLDNGSQTVTPAPGTNASPTEPSTVSAILEKYQNIDPNHMINTKVLQEALLAFDANKSTFTNQNYITVVDFSLRSNNHRFFVVNMSTGAVTGYPVAHGMNSDGNPKGASTGYAVRFSNVSGSNESSLGMYITAETYSGKHGFSERIKGLSTTNSNVYSREIVIHGADYVQDANVVQGRSDGCFALPMDERIGIIDLIQGGSMMYAGLEN